jgi:catechol 2,3-dioxygenase-like lactoylglutathione lyase family enzyme
VIHHVALETAPADRDALAGFFALLGFRRVDPPEALRSRAYWLERGATQIHVLFADDAVAPPQGHVAVVAEDYDEALARLRRAGHDVQERTPHWGAPRCFVSAPGGHRVEVMAFTPPAGRWSASP